MCPNQRIRIKNSDQSAKKLKKALVESLFRCNHIGELTTMSRLKQQIVYGPMPYRAWAKEFSIKKIYVVTIVLHEAE